MRIPISIQDREYLAIHKNDRQPLNWMPSDDYDKDEPDYEEDED